MKTCSAAATSRSQPPAVPVPHSCRKPVRQAVHPGEPKNIKLAARAPARRASGALGTWDIPSDPPGALQIAIEEAASRFLRDAESGRRLDEPTLRKYRLMLRQLQEFAASKGIRYLTELTEIDIEGLRAFRDSMWVPALKKLERVPGHERARFRAVEFA
jgi:hypothetical protein